MARDARMVIRVEENIKDYIQSKAKEMGISMSMLGASIFGEWVAQQKMKDEILERVSGSMVERVMEFEGKHSPKEKKRMQERMMEVVADKVAEKMFEQGAGESESDVMSVAEWQRENVRFSEEDEEQDCGNE